MLEVLHTLKGSFTKGSNPSVMPVSGFVRVADPASRTNFTILKAPTNGFLLIDRTVMQLVRSEAYSAPRVDIVGADVPNTWQFGEPEAAILDGRICQAIDRQHYLLQGGKAFKAELIGAAAGSFVRVYGYTVTPNLQPC